MTEKLLTLKEAAALAAITPDSLRKMLKERRGPKFVRIGGWLFRFRPADIAEWLTPVTPPPAP